MWSIGRHQGQAVECIAECFIPCIILTGSQKFGSLTAVISHGKGARQTHMLMRARCALVQRQDKPLRRELPAYDPDEWQE